MADALFEPGFSTDVDIEALMARIRERVASRQLAASQNGPIDPDLAPTPVDAGPALAAQADFNQSVMRALRVIGDGLQRVQDRTAGLGRRLAVEIEREQEARNALAVEVGHLSDALQELGGRMDAFSARSLALESQLADQQAESRRAVEQAKAEALIQQTEIRQAIEQAKAEALAQQAASLEEVKSGLSALADRAGERDAHVDHHVDELRGQIEDLGAHLRGLDATISHELDEMRVRLLRAERTVRSLNHMPTVAATAATEPGTDGEKAEDAEPKPASADAFDYFLFEHHFRGSTADIKHRQEKYVPTFLGRERVLDLGCGRGEFVELLSEHGVNVTGIDRNQDMVAFCQDRGLRVVLADISEYLEQLPDASLDGMASFQVVEHLTPEQIVRLVTLCGAKLRSSAPLVVETMNPTCPLAMGNFYLDPSHVRPVPADMLRYMLQRGPFTVEGLRFSAPVDATEPVDVLDVAGELPAKVTQYQDYAVIARRR